MGDAGKGFIDKKAYCFLPDNGRSSLVLTYLKYVNGYLRYANGNFMYVC